MTIRALPAALIAATLALSGCAVTGPAQFSAAGAGLPAGASLSIAEPTEGDMQQRELANSLRIAFESQGFSIAENGAYVIRYSVAERPTSVSLARENEAQEVDWISRERRGLLLDKCKPQRLRVNVVAYNLASGNYAYRGAAEVNDCDFSNTDFGNLAGEFAARAAAN